MRLISLFYGLFFIVLMAGSHQTFADIHVDVTGGRIEPLPIAILNFDGADEKAKSKGKDIAEVIRANLARSGLFRPIPAQSFIRQQESIKTQPHFNDWSAINAQALVVGSVEIKWNGNIKVSFRLWDIFGRQQMIGQAFETEGENWRRIAHITSDAIYQRLTGESGYFDTRIVYIAEDGKGRHKRRRMAIMDQDGANHRFLTDGRVDVSTPRFSPTVQQITYMSYYDSVPRIYLFDIESGKQERLEQMSGMSFASRFSPDGRKIVFSKAEDGNTEIYGMDLEDKDMSRLTSHPSIDTSPSYAPDGSKIVFNSDRSGSQQLYIMDADGSNAKRISFGDGRYATPVWSPRGDYIAFTKMKGGTFYIGVMLPDGSGERLLARGYLVEAPTWSPNGRVLIYFKQDKGGPVKLYSVDITGYNERMVNTPVEASDPAWSPLLP